jgi:hypothetical protein
MSIQTRKQNALTSLNMLQNVKIMQDDGNTSHNEKFTEGYTYILACVCIDLRCHYHRNALYHERRKKHEWSAHT